MSDRTDAPLPDLDRLVGYLLKQTQSVLRARIDAALRPLGLTTAQYVCLELLGRHPGMSSAELARGAFVTRQTMTSLLAALHERGLVRREAQAPSGRARPVSLTAEGARLRVEGARRAEAVEARMLSGLDGEDRERLRTLLGECLRALA